jgi:hypothetical protein
MNMKKTPWFSWSTPPVHPGWYQVRGHFSDGPRNGERIGIVMRFWDGGRWYWSDEGDLKGAIVGGEYWPNEKWRGLVERA